MSLLLRYNAGFGAEGFLPVCVTDCYPGTTDPASTPIGGIYLLSSVSLPVGTPPKIMDVHGNCASLVSAELGSAALAPDGWKVVFNGPRDAVVQGGDAYSSSTMNQDVGFVSVTSGPTAGAVVWLTTTPGDEADASIARWETPESSLEQYLVGWLDTDTSQHFLRVVDANGANVDGDYDITAIAQWGSRDDPFRQHFNGDIVWAWFDAAGDSVLHFARVDSRGSYACQTF
jgi:hypothetical protein